MNIDITFWEINREGETTNELCISPKYLTVVCKKNSGKTANEWITEHVLLSEIIV